MKNKRIKKWLLGLAAMFLIVLTVGCGEDTGNKPTNQNVIETENEAPIVTARNQTVGYGAKLNYSELATVEDKDSEQVQLIISSSGLEGITFDNDAQTVSFEKIGDFTIEFTATDEEGNKTVEKVSVVVEDQVAPTLTLSSITFSFTEGDSAPNYASAAKAIDDVDGDVTSSIKVDSSNVNRNSAGTYEIIYTVTDSSGNTATERATVTVIAKPAPQSSSSGSSTTYVLITRTGDCYHTHKCGNGTFFEVTLEEALQRGLRKCKKCY